MWAGTKETRYVYRMFVIKHLGKRSLREPRKVCVDMVRIHVTVTRYEDESGPGSYVLAGIHINGIRTSAFVKRNSVTTIIRRYILANISIRVSLQPRLGTSFAKHSQNRCNVCYENPSRKPETFWNKHNFVSNTKTCLDRSSLKQLSVTDSLSGNIWKVGSKQKISFCSMSKFPGRYFAMCAQYQHSLSTITQYKGKRMSFVSHVTWQTIQSRSSFMRSSSRLSASQSETRRTEECNDNSNKAFVNHYLWMTTVFWDETPFSLTQERQPHVPRRVQAHATNEQIRDIKRGATSHGLLIFKFWAQ
jgi:hypothetical protein